MRWFGLALIIAVGLTIAPAVVAIVAIVWLVLNRKAWT